MNNPLAWVAMRSHLSGPSTSIVHTMAEIGSTLKAKKIPALSDMVSVHPDFKSMPLMWDTGASQGLTPFLKDFIHYESAQGCLED